MSQFSSSGLLPEMFPARLSAAYIINAVFLCQASVNKAALAALKAALGSVGKQRSPVSKLCPGSQRSS